MLHWKRSGILFILALLASISSSFAADSASHKFPRVVLVQLKAEQNRIEALTKKKRYKELEEVQKDAAMAMQAMISDFKDNFKYCPVYYYIDTNLEAVKNKEFYGVLLNADLSVATGYALNNTNTDYLIVCYGYPGVQEKKESVGSATEVSNVGRGLIVFNDKYEQIAYAAKAAFSEGSDKSNRENKYAYVSKHFDIRYIPFAAQFNAALKGEDTFKGHIRKKRSGK